MSKTGVTFVVFIFCFAYSLKGMAQAGFTSEDELSAVTTSGNTEVRTYRAKTDNRYTQKGHSFVTIGSYTFSEASQVKIVEKWDLLLRYEEELSPIYSFFVSQQVEGNQFAGFDRRFNTDIGIKYYFSKEESNTTLIEVGLRESLEDKTNPLLDDVSSGKGRLYFETSQKIGETSFGKFWIEYVPNFTYGEDYLVNYEPSLTVTLSSNFSLKLALLVNYDNRPAQQKMHDSIYTTSLIAKF